MITAMKGKNWVLWVGHLWEWEEALLIIMSEQQVKTRTMPGRWEHMVTNRESNFHLTGKGRGKLDPKNQKHPVMQDPREGQSE